MSPFIVPWSFFLMFDYEKNQLKISFSDEIRRTIQAENHHIVLTGDSIREYIHKYDYRKLIYFSQNPLVQPFDTVLRLRIPLTKPYIRTQAICKSHQQGFNCILIEDKYLHKLKPLWQLEDERNRVISFLDEMIFELSPEKEIGLFKSHLAQLLSKVLN